MKNNKIYILERSINHALGKTIEEICDWYNNESAIPLIDSTKLYQENMIKMPILKNQNKLSITPNILRKMDAFCAYCVDGINDMSIESYPKERMGLFLGSCLGGLSTAEREIRILENEGPGRVSPFLSIAMFYSSSISQISIIYNITGPSYLYSDGFLSGFSSIIHASESIKENVIPISIVGASDMPFSPTCVKAYNDIGLLEQNNYVTDGSAMLLLGTEQYIENKDCVEIAGFGYGYFHPDKIEDSLNKALQECLASSMVSKEEIDLVVLSDNYFEDQREREFNFFSTLLDAQYLSLSKLLGNSFSATSVQKLLIAESILLNKNLPFNMRDNSVATIILSSIDISGNCIMILLKK